MPFLRYWGLLMAFISKDKVLCTLTTLFIVLLSASPPAWSRPRTGFMPLSIESKQVLERIKTEGASTIECFAPLSTESRRVLERIKTEVNAYNARLKSGEIEFSVTLRQKHGADTHLSLLQFLESKWDALLHSKEAEKAPAYEDIGYWHITYKFDGDTQFFDVKARKKREINGNSISIRVKDGRPYSPHHIWRETHHQYLIYREKLYLRDGATWKPYVDTGAGPVFDERFSPHWWIGFSQADTLSQAKTFEKFMHPYEPVHVQPVEMDGSPLYYLQGYSGEKKDGFARYATFTREIWMNPQKDFHVTRIVTCEKGAEFISYEGRLWPLRKLNIFNPPEELFIGVHCNIKTYQLAQYEPGIWFPKTVTEVEKRSGMSMFDLFPDTPISEYPPIVVSFLNDTRLPEWFEEGAFPEPRFKRGMKVHRAVFNIPVSIPDSVP